MATETATSLLFAAAIGIRHLAQLWLTRSKVAGARSGWRQQGHPFYGAGVRYRQRFDLGKPKGSYAVNLPDWYGSVARVEVNGKPAGHIVAPPWKCDVRSVSHQQLEEIACLLRDRTGIEAGVFA